MFSDLFAAIDMLDVDLATVREEGYWSVHEQVITGRVIEYEYHSEDIIEEKECIITHKKM